MKNNSSKAGVLVPGGANPAPDSDTPTEEVLARLAQAEEMIRAIHAGEVDALVVNTPQGPSVYTLEGAEHPYRVLVERMQEGTLTIDLSGVVLYSNPQFASMMSAPLESIPGSRFESFVNPISRDDFAELIESAMNAGHRSAELVLLDSKRDTVPVRISLSRLDLTGVSAISILVTDLREQRRHESIAREEQLSRLILEQAGEAIVVIDPEGRIIRRSESAKLIAGRAIWTDHFDHTFPLQVAGEACNVERILTAIRRGETIRALEATMAGPGGACLSLLVSASPLWGDAKELLGCVITLIDITDRQHAEAALARQSEELARSNSDLRQFAYSASHDLREPVRQIAVFSELLGERFQSQLGEEGAYLIRHTVDAAHRIEKLLKDLLAYMQAAEAPQPPPSGVDATGVVSRVLATLQPVIAETGARLECGPLPRLAIHEVHLTELIQNLVGNALKYRSERPPVIRIQATTGNPMCTLSVEDNGIGIESQYRQRIFGLFQRLHGGDKYSGSGIGLAICHKIVQRYGGHIWVESEPGRGSKFLFTIPEAKV